MLDSKDIPFMEGQLIAPRYRFTYVRSSEK